MVQAAVGELIPAPVLSPPANSLLKAAQGPIENVGRIGAGIRWDSESCPQGTIVEYCDATDVDYADFSRAGVRSHPGFIVRTWDRCSAMGFQSADYQGRAIRALQAIEASLVEREFWTGALRPDAAHLADTTTNEVQTITVTASGGTYTLTYDGETTTALAFDANAAAIDAALEALSNIPAGGVSVTGTGPYVITFTGDLAGEDVSAIVVDDALATGGDVTIAQTTPGDNAAVIMTGSAASPLRAFALLEQALADGNCGAGLIHARPLVVAYWQAAGLLIDRDRKLMTPSGNTVVAGTGYPGTGPNGQAVTASSEWAYATEQIGIVRDAVINVPAVDMAQQLDRTTNEVVVEAQRAYAIQWDQCCHYAAEIDPTT